MNITKTVTVDQITVTENGNVLFREVTRIMEDSKEIGRTYHRTTLEPGQDLTGQPDQVIAIAQAAWTPDVIAAYEAQVQASRQFLGQ